MRLVDADAIEKQAYDDVHHHAELEDWEFDVVTNYLDRAPTIDAVPVVHGRWEFDGSDFADIWKCSACGEYWFFEYDPRDAKTLVKFCPNCGARMDGGAANGI